MMILWLRLQSTGITSYIPPCLPKFWHKSWIGEFERPGTPYLKRFRDQGGEIMEWQEKCLCPQSHIAEGQWPGTGPWIMPEKHTQAWVSSADQETLAQWGFAIPRSKPSWCWANFWILTFLRDWVIKCSNTKKLTAIKIVSCCSVNSFYSLLLKLGNSSSSFSSKWPALQPCPQSHTKSLHSSGPKCPFPQAVL